MAPGTRRSRPTGLRWSRRPPVAVARRAIESRPWPRTRNRVTVLERVRELLDARRAELATLITDEMGAPISQSLALHVGSPVAMLGSYIELAKQFRLCDVRLDGSGIGLVSMPGWSGGRHRSVPLLRADAVGCCDHRYRAKRPPSTTIVSPVT